MRGLDHVSQPGQGIDDALGNREEKSLSKDLPFHSENQCSPGIPLSVCKVIDLVIGFW
ncbi:hypothetical protein ES703_64749 [subsurface metagenome]